jgi:predicted nucleotidyltransferase component of viral defense system
MSLSSKDYRKLYLLQDKFLRWWVTLNLPFYLTGGTALGRYYLNHRFSDDLDFFVNADQRYISYISVIRDRIQESFSTDLQNSLFADDFSRFYITGDGVMLKIEFVNDVSYYPGEPLPWDFGLIDRPLNILSNKLTAIVGRDEPKDIFDIVCLSRKYAFNWKDIFFHSKQKSLINEIDVEQRLYSFPVEWLRSIQWLNTPADLKLFETDLRQVADDFLLGKDNSFGTGKIPIENGMPGRFE